MLLGKKKLINSKAQPYPGIGIPDLNHWTGIYSSDIWYYTHLYNILFTSETKGLKKYRIPWVPKTTKIRFFYMEGLIGIGQPFFIAEKDGY